MLGMPILKMQKVSIHMNNVKLDKILNEIENQTDYLFIYNNQVDINKILP